MTKTPVALFDFDNTICAGDSILPYLLFCIREGLAPKAQLFIAAAAWLYQKLHPEEISYSKQRSLSFITGQSKMAMDAAADRFLARYIKRRAYPEAIGTIRELKRDGWIIAVVSASPDVYMNRLPQFLPVDIVLATPCLLDQSGIYTGLIGANCKGEEKARRLQEMSFNGGILRAYGDSGSDADMLRLAAEPILVNPGPALKAAFPGARCMRWKGKTKKGPSR